MAVRFQLLSQQVGLEAFWENWTGKATLLLGLFRGKNKECVVPTC